MRKLLKQPWFVAVLALSAIVLCTVSLREQLGGGGGSSAGRRAAASGPVDSAPLEDSGDESNNAVVANTPQAIAAILAKLEFPKTIPDPFSRGRVTVVAGETPVAAPGIVLPDERDTIRLTAVWQQNGLRLALVNNQIVRAGDKLGRVTIEEITVEGIWVSHWKGRDFVAFGEAFTLLTPAEGAPAAAPAPAPSVALHES